jgi:hypothetical protein
MLHIYTRHAADCGHADDTQWRRCRCPKWLRGVLPNGEAVRESAGTRSWEQAERNARKKEAEANPTRVDWTERHHHIGGPLGVTLFSRLTEAGWLLQRPGTRALAVTLKGREGLDRQLGVR